MCTADSEEWNERGLIMLLGLMWATVMYYSNEFHPFIPTAIIGLRNFRAGRESLHSYRPRMNRIFKANAHNSRSEP